MSEVLEVFKALADEARLRILLALGEAELSVAEIVGALQMPQSSVSRHLKPLRDAELVDARRDGTSVYYRRGAAFEDAAFAGLMDRRLEELEMAQQDRAAVQQVLELRRRRSMDFFDEVAGRYSKLTEVGGGWQATAAALAFGFAGSTVADVGCGEGQISLLLARSARKVVAIDMSEQMLAVVREKARAEGCLSRIVTKKGEVESLPLKDASMDAVFMSQVLHHAAQPARAIREAARVLRPGGMLLLLDLARHDQEWVRAEWADQWLGFDAKEVCGWMEAAGLEQVFSTRLPGSTPEMAVLLCRALKPQT